MTGREGCGIWGPWVTVKPEEGQGPTSAGEGWQHPDLAKMGASPSRTQVGRWRLGTNSPGRSPVDSSSCRSWAGRDEPLSDFCPGRESTGEIINNTVPLENSIPGNCCSALFKNLVRGLWGAVGGVLRPGKCPREGVRSPGEAVSALTPLALAPSPASEENQAV